MIVVSDKWYQEGASLCLFYKGPKDGLLVFFCFCKMCVPELLFKLRGDILIGKNIIIFKRYDEFFLVFRIFGILSNSFKSLQLWPKIDGCYLNSKGLFYMGSRMNYRRDSEYNPFLHPCCI